MAWKIPPRRVTTDDCQVVVDGETYTPHEGEWIEYLPVAQLGAALTLLELAGGMNPEDAENLTPEEQQTFAAVMSEICAATAERLTGWSWTGWDGAPLPPPYRKPEVVRALSAEEITYLSTLILRGESPGQRKNGSAGSLVTSSSTSRQPRR